MPPKKNLIRTTTASVLIIFHLPSVHFSFSKKTKVNDQANLEKRGAGLTALNNEYNEISFDDKTSGIGITPRGEGTAARDAAGRLINVKKGELPVE